MADIESKTSINVLSQPRVQHDNFRKFANPTPLGLFSFASTALILSLINIQAREVTEPNIAVGMGLVCGGLAQLLAGMWEFACGNTLGATAFSSYGAFWISWALIHIPGTGIIDAYANSAEDLGNAVAFYLTPWFIFTFCMFLASFRTSVALVTLFFFLDLTFMFLMIGAYNQHVTVTKIGGAIGILTSGITYYVAAAGLLSPENSYITLPVGDLSKYHSN